jgi:hypothetical protein
VSHVTELTIYQLKVALLGISPTIWRRLLVRGDSTIADLHHILHIAMGWTDTQSSPYHPGSSALLILLAKSIAQE